MLKYNLEEILLLVFSVQPIGQKCALNITAK